MKNISQASQIRHFVESILSDENGRRQKSSARIDTRGVANSTEGQENRAIAYKDNHMRAQGQELRASSADVRSEGPTTRTAELAGAQSQHETTSRNYLNQSRSSEARLAGVNAPGG